MLKDGDLVVLPDGSTATLLRRPERKEKEGWIVRHTVRGKIYVATKEIELHPAIARLEQQNRQMQRQIRSLSDRALREKVSTHGSRLSEMFGMVRSIATRALRWSAGSDRRTTRLERKIRLTQAALRQVAEASGVDLSEFYLEERSPIDVERSCARKLKRIDEQTQQRSKTIPTQWLVNQ